MTKKITIAVFFLLLFGVVQIPIWSIRIPPLVDYPNHLARMHILTHHHEISLLQKYYLVNWEVLPNLAMDAIVPMLAKLMPLEVAGKCFLVLIFLLLMSGTFAIHYVVHGKWSPWPLLSVLFLYSWPFLWGLVNFLFGVGLSLWMFAGWIYCREKSYFSRVAVFGVLALALFFSHLYAFGIYTLCILGYEFHRMRRGASKEPFCDYLVLFSQFLLPAMLLLFLSPTTHSPESHKILFGDPLRKIYFLINPVRNYNAILDFSTFFILSGSFLLGILTGAIRVSKKLLYPLGLLALFYLIMPELLFTVWFADMRIPTAASFLLVAGSALTTKEVRWRKGVFAVILILFTLRMGLISMHWEKADKEYSQYLEAIDTIDEGSRLFVANPFAGDWEPFPAPINHLPCYAIIAKSAFVPSLFAHETQQPVAYTPGYRELAKETPEPFEVRKDLTWNRYVEDYDFLLVRREHLFVNEIPTELKTIYYGDDFRLLKTSRTATGY